MSPDTPETDAAEPGSAVPASWPWSALGLPKMPPDARDIRRAYARALKQIDQTTDLEGFATLRHAYDAALSIREGRSERNAQRRARKVAKTAATTPAAEDLPAPAPPPVDTAQQTAEAALTAAIEALITPLLDDDRSEPAYKRILTALAAPLGQSPEVEPLLRNACARLIRKHQRPDFNGNFTLSPQITEEALLALDARFGWLNDFIAFRQDFGHDTALQHELATRTYGNFQMAATLVPSDAPKTGVDPRLLVIGGIVLLKVITVASSNSNSMTADDLLGLAGFAAVLGRLYWVYKMLRRKFLPVFAAIITCWLAAIVPLLLYAPDFTPGVKDYSLAWLWLGLTNIALFITCFRPAATWLLRRFHARNSAK